MVNIAQHSNMLKPSHTDLVQLSEAVDSRFVDLLGTYYRVKHEKLMPPKYLDVDMVLWRVMFARYKKRDFRNTDDEERAVRRIAEWTLEENCKLKGQPYVPIDWGD